MDHVHKTPDILETATVYADHSLEKILQDTNAQLYHTESNLRKANLSVKRHIKSFRKWLRHQNADDDRSAISERQKEWTVNSQTVIDLTKNDKK
jgi:adenylate kinase family enzyme